MEATGLVAERPGGEPMTLGDITVVNEVWGGAGG
jgi:hypothetical protein